MKNEMFYRILFAAAFGLALLIKVDAQSTAQDFPTPIVSNEISGTIKARDLGDSRLTTYYYALNGDQGDLFINLVTRNFTGDIDVFTVSGQRPMTKIVVYADYAEAETGRAIYLRKPEKLLLRIQGRTPNDDEAAFKLKFAGSFIAARADEVQSGPDLPKVTAENRGVIRVNSVGTILPQPKADEPIKTGAETESDRSARTEPVKPADIVEKSSSSDSPDRGTKRADSARREPATSAARSRRTRVPVPAAVPKAEASGTDTTDLADDEKTSAVKEDSKTVVMRPPEPAADGRKSKPVKRIVEPKPDPLASINLVVQFKDGQTLEKKMSEVFKFGVDKGVLTIILKDGSVTRYPIVEVAKLTIE